MLFSGADHAGVGMQQVTLQNLLSSSNFISDGLAQPVQWHIWTDGAAVVSALSIRGKWVKGPELEYADTNTGTRIAKLAEELVRLGRDGQKWATMAVVFHCADEFHCCTVKEAMASPDKYDVAESLILEEPESVIDEKAQKGAAYRYLPLPGQRTAISVKIQGERFGVFQALISQASRIRCVMASAPLEMIAAIPAFLAHRSVDPSVKAGADIVVLAYSRFAVVACFRTVTRDDSSNGRSDPGTGLLSVANVPGGRGVADRIRTEIVKESLSDVAVFVIQASPSGNAEQIVEDLQKGLYGRAESVQIGTLDMAAIREEMAQLSPGWVMPPDELFRPEFLSAHRELSLLPGNAVWHGSDVGGEAFCRAAMQNYSIQALRVEESRISYKEALIALLLRGASFVTLLIFVAWIVFIGIDVSRTLRSEAWNLPPERADEAAAEVVRLTQLDRAIAHWRSLVRPRSDAWSVMEAVCDILPEDQGLAARSVEYRVEMMMPATKSAKVKPQWVGYRRIWIIKGLATERGAAFLDTVSTERINDIMSGLLSRFGIKSDGKWPLTANIERQQKTPISINGVAYPVEFTLAISQVIPETEKELALPATSVAIPPISMTTNQQ